METIENNNNLLSRIVIKFRDSFYLAHYEPEAVSEFFCENNVIGWNRLLTQFHGIAVNNLFTSIHPTRIIEIVEKAKKLDSRYCPPAFLSYYAIDCPEKANVELLLKQLHQEQNVELAYIETGMTIPQALFLEETPFTLWPDHLKPAPVGIDVKYAWSIKGGDGEGRVKFIDIEQGWILDRKNLSISTIPNTGIIQQKFRDHGTAVLSLVAQNGEIGETGITPRANVYVVSQWRPDGAPNTADAIMTAIDNLSFGDIILLEAQVFDPSESLQLWPVEIQEAIFQVIRLATAAGITVVEAAGNGNFNCTKGNDLDLFSDKCGKNILDRSSTYFKDSGAIIVGAAQGYEKHERIRYSNYGSRVDCYALSERVVTACGEENRHMRNFSGTSCAAAIVAGAAIAVQSICEANDKSRLSSKQMRDVLGNDLYGTPSANGRLNDKIGAMPDLKKIIDEKIMCSKGS